MAPIDGIGNNPFLMQGVNPYIQGGQKPKINPFQQQPVQAPKQAGGVPGTGEPIDKQLAFIAQNGMRVNDTEMGVNQPFATHVKGGVQGGQFRMLS